jgi:hypothetical protein
MQYWRCTTRLNTTFSPSLASSEAFKIRSSASAQAIAIQILVITSKFFAISSLTINKVSMSYFMLYFYIIAADNARTLPIILSFIASMRCSVLPPSTLSVASALKLITIHAFLSEYLSSLDFGEESFSGCFYYFLLFHKFYLHGIPFSQCQES